MTLKVYFGCSMRGGYPNVSFEDLAEIARVIEDLGFYLESHHQTDKKYISHEEHVHNKKHETIIHDRDYDWMKEADIGIFEISNHSLGTGAEISDMIHMGKPVLCLYKHGLKDKVSRYVMGKHGSHHVSTKFEVYEYQTIGDAKYGIKKFVNNLNNH